MRKSGRARNAARLQLPSSRASASVSCPWPPPTPVMHEEARAPPAGWRRQSGDPQASIVGSDSSGGRRRRRPVCARRCCPGAAAGGRAGRLQSRCARRERSVRGTRASAERCGWRAESVWFVSEVGGPSQCSVVDWWLGCQRWDEMELMPHSAVRGERLGIRVTGADSSLENKGRLFHYGEYLLTNIIIPVAIEMPNIHNEMCRKD